MIGAVPRHLKNVKRKFFSNSLGIIPTQISSFFKLKTAAAQLLFSYSQLFVNNNLEM